MFDMELENMLVVDGVDGNGRNMKFEGMLAEALLEAVDYVFATKVNEETPLETLRAKVLKVLNTNGNKVLDLARKIKALDQKVTAGLTSVTDITVKISTALSEQKHIKEKLAEIKAVNASSYEKKRRVVEATKLLKESDVVIASLFVQKKAFQGRVSALKNEKVVLVRALKSLNLIEKQYKSALANDAELILLAA